jgi:DNA transformation protein and related proteins
LGTEKETVEFILAKLGPKRFSARAMFGEYALYAGAKIVALICDDLLYVKDHPTTKGLAKECEMGRPYPGAKPHFIVEEGQLSTISDLVPTLLRLAASLPESKPRASRRKLATK